MNLWEMIASFYKTWWEVVSAPLTFYHKIGKQSWDDEPLSFLVGGGWLAGFFVSIAIFLTQYIVIGSGLLEEVVGIKVLYVIPALTVLALTFFLMTFLIAGGVIVGFFIVFFVLLGGILHGMAKLFKGKGTFTDTLKATFYGSAALQSLILLSILAVLVKFKLFNFPTFIVGENVIYVLSAIYMWGLISIGCRRVHHTGRAISVLAASAPFVVAILINWFLSVGFLPKFAPWLG